ncbi:site-specific integrase [Microcoleus sp. FACHB-1515]|uniref:tyrosine-type recombinase/integrase n=1 Tax=Cyanophyceae TaxID=3028117 RepID=UPI001682B5C5|nr:site-specific integrase [Microcoleus sp. FACHB-1515]MBD2090676.1 site-specific integrase [Microcoleus sp. FACHB-1515]
MKRIQTLGCKSIKIAHLVRARPMIHQLDSQGNNRLPLPPIPSCVRTFEGFELTTAGDWQLFAGPSQSKLQLCWEPFQQGPVQMTDRFLHQLQLCWVARLQQKRSNTVYNDYGAVRQLHKWLNSAKGQTVVGAQFDWWNFTIELAFIWLEDLQQSSTQRFNAPKHHFNPVRFLYQLGAKLQLPDFSAEIAAQLEDLKLTGIRRQLQINFDLPTLECPVHCADGQVVDTASEKWNALYDIRTSKGITFNFNLLRKSPSVFSERFIHQVKLILIGQLKTLKPSTVHHSFQIIGDLDGWLRREVGQSFLEGRLFEWNDFTLELAQNWLDDLEKISSKRGLPFSKVRGMYELALETLALPDFSSSVLEGLREMTPLSADRGKHVRGFDPKTGPLSQAEEALLKMALEAELGQPEDRAIIMLLLHLGVRPHSLAILKVSHLKRYEQEGDVIYHLTVSPIKRETTVKNRPIPRQLGELLEQLQPDSAQPNDSLLFWLRASDPTLHMRQLLKRFIKASDLVSPETGKLLHLFPRRLRYTLATYLAEMGAPLSVVSELLGHDAIENVQTYVEMRMSVAHNIGKATAAALNPRIKYFTGHKIIDSLEEIKSPGVPLELIFDVAFNLKVFDKQPQVLGGCTRNPSQECHLFPPFSCYCCPKFAALRSAPHQSWLETIELFLEQSAGQVDDRILMQMNTTRYAVQELLVQLSGL